MQDKELNFIIKFVDSSQNPRNKKGGVSNIKVFKKSNLEPKGVLNMYTANVCRDLQGLCWEMGVRGFQIYGDCMYTPNPCNF